MFPFVFALSLVLLFARAAVTATTLTVRTHFVIQFLESSGTVIDWVPVGNNVSLAIFPNEDWVSWENELLSLNESITVPNASFRYDKRLESLDYRYSCYRSGSWAKDSVLEAHIDHACETFKHGLNVGTTQLQKYPKLRNVAGDEMEVYMRYTPYDSGRGAKLSCKSLLSTLINKQCQGAHQDTRGGGIWWYRGNHHRLAHRNYITFQKISTCHEDLTRARLNEAALCEALERRILTIVHAIYTLSSKSPPSVLISNKPDGTPAAQVVVFDLAGALVLMEETGFLPAKTGVGGRSIAMENLLAKMEATWAMSCRTLGNTRVGGLYYVAKPMSGLKYKGKD